DAPIPRRRAPTPSGARGDKRILVRFTRQLVYHEQRPPRRRFGDHVRQGFPARRRACRRGPGAGPMPPRDDAPRDLLLGLLASQNGMVSKAQLVTAFAAWTVTPGRSMADLLVEQNALDPDGRDLLLGLTQRHLRAHGDDPEKSLAALGVNA